jgi:hypothetical protein
MTEGPYLALPAVILILAGVMVLAVLSSLALEFFSLRHRHVTVVFYGLLVALWLAAIFIAELIRPAGWW